MIDNINDKIVLYGMSCCGKTTFAKQFINHTYYCFDFLFKWELIETLGVSIKANFQHIQKTCQADKFVLDGWHLADKEGKYLPENSVVYVVYATYDQIISQYRVDVLDHDQHRIMYRQWYNIDYIRLKARYFLNDGKSFEETDYAAFNAITNS
jgi:hypothetical protein